VAICTHAPAYSFYLSHSACLNYFFAGRAAQ